MREHLCGTSVSNLPRMPWYSRCLWARALQHITQNEQWREGREQKAKIPWRCKSSVREQREVKLLVVGTAEQQRGVGGSLEAAFRSGHSWRREASCRGTLERCCLPRSSAARRGPRRAGRACRSLSQVAKPGTFEMCAGHRAIATRTAVLPTQSTRKGACSYAAHAHSWQMVSLQYLAQLCCQAPHNVPALGAH